MKLVDKLEYFIGGVCTVPFVWMAASWADVLINQFGGHPAWWNFFTVMTKL